VFRISKTVYFPAHYELLGLLLYLDIQISLFFQYMKSCCTNAKPTGTGKRTEAGEEKRNREDDMNEFGKNENGRWFLEAGREPARPQYRIRVLSI
jgi:hypothetical protein